MANVPAQGMKSFAFHAGDEDACQAKLLTGWNVVRSRKPPKLEDAPRKIGSEAFEGTSSLCDLPIRFWDESKRATNQCTDLVKDVRAKFKFELIEWKLEVSFRAVSYRSVPFFLAS